MIFSLFLQVEFGNSFMDLHRIVRRELNPGSIFWLFFILQLVSNFSWQLLYPDAMASVMTVGLSGVIAAVATLPAVLLKKHRRWMTVYVTIVLTWMTVLIVADYFILINFRNVVCQDIVDIIYETNTSESSEFLDTYLSAGRVLIGIAALALLLTLALILAKIISAMRWAHFAAVVVTAVGVLTGAYCVFNFVKYRDGHSIPQFTSATRTVHSLYMLRQRVGETKAIIDNTRRLLTDVAGATSSVSDLTVVLVIGESHSTFHTPAYGYEKNTMPLISSRKQTDSIVWLRDVIAVSDHTHPVMCSLFSHRLPRSGEEVIFPAVFKHLDYKSYLYDNQYISGQGVSFINDATLSGLVYDDRNNHSYSDEDLMSLTEADSTGRNLVVYHLMGSHYTYAARYPHERFGKFAASDYAESHTPEQREILAHYDNSIVYTDFLLDRLLSRLQDRNAVVVYLSDHGEEVFDIDSYLGHGTASGRSNKDYQLRIPMFVWMSEKYTETHPGRFGQLLSNADKPFISSLTSHLLLDLAGAPDSLLDSTKSIANRGFVPQERITLHSFNYDHRGL